MNQTLLQMDPKDIVVRGGWNPRTDFTHIEMWRSSLQECGVMQPLMIKWNGEVFELVAGETRLRAVLQLLEEGITTAENGESLERIPVITIDPNETEARTFDRMVLENSHTSLNPLDEAQMFLRYRDEYKLTLAQIAKRAGRSVVYVVERMVLLDASPEVIEALQKKKVGLVKAVKIVREHRQDPAAQAAAVNLLPQIDPDAGSSTPPPVMTTHLPERQMNWVEEIEKHVNQWSNVTVPKVFGFSDKGIQYVGIDHLIGLVHGLVLAAGDTEAIRGLEELLKCKDSSIAPERILKIIKHLKED